MFIKLCVILICLLFCASSEENHNWDLAVAVYDQIELLKSNGSLIGATKSQFTTLKALTFDNIRHQFVVSDMDQLNDTIFTVQLTKETDITPIIQDLPDDVKGLAIDPITDILYWTDSKNHTINTVALNESFAQSNILFAFKHENPEALVVDVCRRYLYWTNSDFKNPTIERSRLDGTERTILIDSGLDIPVGISIDYKSQRLYWADMGEGIYYRIESSDLQGKERQIVFEGTHTKPFGIAVDDRAIYWTDINNNALWRIEKHNPNSNPIKIRSFQEKPRGLVAKNMQITTFPDCKILSDAIEEYNGSLIEIFEKEADSDIEEEVVDVCLNDGELVNGVCVCGHGYTGRFCEISLCHNYCVHGKCYVSSEGYPQCHCPGGLSGRRCERDLCEGYCLNDGICRYIGRPHCSCRSGFFGPRCEINEDFDQLCEVFCRSRSGDHFVSTNNDLVCSCIEGSFIISKSNATSARLMSQQANSDYDFTLNKLRDPIFLLETTFLLICAVTIIILTLYVCKVRKLRPRIKKRIIVNKNVTPLTYRPQPTTEQCEITIENCCNMNVCETPCFEPPSLRFQKPDDKKKLLSNMENGEDMY